MHHITCHHLALSLVSDSLRLLSLGTQWSAKERSTRYFDAPWMIRWTATSWPSRHWQPTHATTIKGSRNLRSWSLFRPTQAPRGHARPTAAEFSTSHQVSTAATTQVYSTLRSLLLEDTTTTSSTVYRQLSSGLGASTASTSASASSSASFFCE